MSILDDLTSVVKNPYAKLLKDRPEITGYIDTGSLMMNAQFSGTIFGGIPRNRVSILAGPSKTGKTFILTRMIKLFQQKYPDSQVVFWETEFGTHEEDFIDRGIDMDRFKLLRVNVIQDLQNQMFAIVNKYNELSWKDKYPLLFAVDSLGHLSTTKEITDIKDNKDVQDMTRAKLIKKFFRTMIMELGVAGVDMICTNHVYSPQDGTNKKKQSGGTGAEYSPSVCIFLESSLEWSDSKENPEDTIGKVGSLVRQNITSNIVTSIAEKCRAVREGSRVKVKINHKKGLSRVYGVFDFALENGIITKEGNQYYIPGVEGKSFRKHIEADPKKYFTKELLKAVDEKCREVFTYTKNHADDEIDVDSLVS